MYHDPVHFIHTTTLRGVHLLKLKASYTLEVFIRSAATTVRRQRTTVRTTTRIQTSIKRRKTALQMADTLSRKRIIHAVGATALVPTVAAVAFSIIYALSTYPHHLTLTALSIVSAALNFTSCISILLFTFLPPQKLLHRLLGAIPSVLSATLSALTLDWLTLEHDALPPNTLGANTFHLLLAGFGTYSLLLVAQSIFWTFINISHKPAIDLETSPTFFCRSNRRTVDLSFPSTDNSCSQSVSSLTSTIHDTKNPYITRIYHTTASATSSKPTLVHKTSPTNTGFAPLQPIPDAEMPLSAGWERNHFDDWETSDISMTERVTATLAAAEREVLEEEKQYNRGRSTHRNGNGNGNGKARKARPKPLDLGLPNATHLSANFRPESGESGVSGVSQAISTATSLPERRMSPPLPLSPRNKDFGQVETGYTIAPGGTGRWLMRSRSQDC
jgi:hypothetical protein